MHKKKKKQRQNEQLSKADTKRNIKHLPKAYTEDTNIYHLQKHKQKAQTESTIRKHNQKAQTESTIRKDSSVKDKASKKLEKKKRWQIVICLFQDAADGDHQ